MFTFKIDENSVEIFGKRIEDATKGKIKKGLGDIKREWQKEFVRQRARLQSKWTKLKGYTIKDGKRTGEKGSYYARKREEYLHHRNNVRYLSILTRTGEMLEGYIQGIRVDNINLSVEIPFPNLRAEVHQGIREKPRGMLAYRPFEVEKFEDIAIRIMDEAI